MENGVEIELTAAEEAARDAEEEAWLAGTLSRAWKKVRDIRDDLLALSDWTQLLDVPLKTTELGKWKAYRQKLRNLPQDFTDPKDVVWFASPSGHLPPEAKE